MTGVGWDIIHAAIAATGGLFAVLVYSLRGLRRITRHLESIESQCMGGGKAERG